jgi:SnoaL-like domain
MSKHVTISPAEAADRLAMRELVEAYARCADRRDVKGQMSLFIEDTHFVFYRTQRIPSLHRNCARATRSLPCSLT